MIADNVAHATTDDDGKMPGSLLRLSNGQGAACSWNSIRQSSCTIWQPAAESTKLATLVVLVA